MRDLFGDQQREEIAIGPRLPLGALHEVAPHAAGIGQMQPLEERIEVVIGGDHDRPPTRRDGCRRARPRPGAPLRSAPAGAFGDLDPACARQSGAAIVGGRSGTGQTGRPGLDVAEIVRDVLGADRLLGEAALEGAAQRRIAVRLQQRVQPLDIVNPDAAGADA